MLAIYCRISKEKEEGKDRSINDQKQLGIDLANDLNIPYKVFIDEGISGTLPIEKRPEFSLLLDEIENHKFTHLYAYDQSRLERSPETRLILNKLLKDNGISLYTDNGEVDLHNDEVEMLGDVMSAFNSYFVRQTRKKVKSVLKRRVKEGKAHSSILPYGYKKDLNGFLAIDEEEAEIIKRIYKESLKGKGTNKIAEILNSEGVFTRYNKIGKGTITTINKYTKEATTKRKKDINWSGNTIRNIIKNTLYKGNRNYSGEVFKAPIIINTIQWQKVNDNLKKNRNNSGVNVEHKYLLKGKLICGKCRRNYYGRTRVNKKDNFYMCSSKRIKLENCGNRSINITVLEDLIWQRFFADKQLLSIVNKHFENNDLDTIIFNLNNKLESLNNDLLSNATQRKKAIKLAINGLLDEEDIKPEIQRIDREKNDIEIKIGNIEEQLYSYNNINLKKDEVDADLFNLKNVSFNDKKDLINKYISEIEILFKEPFYVLRLKFNIPNIDIEYYIIEKLYDIAWDFSNQITIPLSDKSKKYTVEELEQKAEILGTKFMKSNIFLDIHNSRIIF